MRKFQIFLFIEACLLTGALIMMVSEHFSRFLLILLLFLLLIRYYTGKQGNNFILVAVSILFFFIIMLNPFVILAIFVAFDLQPVPALPYDEPGKRRYQSGF